MPVSLSAPLVDTFISALPAAGDWLLMSAAVIVAYVIFGIAGFGTALVASPVLACAMPVAQIVPMLALLDFGAASGSVLRNVREADTGELRRLLPAIIVGSVAGATLLLHLRPDVLLRALAWFICAYAVFSLVGPRAKSRLSQAWAIPFGAAGGMLGAMFGSGGFLYAIYLTSRLERVEAMRVTQATLIGLSTLVRAAMFLLAGVYASLPMLMNAVSLIPAMAAGMWLGRHITLRLSRQQFVKAVNLVVLAAGLALLLRGR
ncbi:sulfite exporter TauE/SafE family protein [Pandoraea nosoerga]|uniref:Probable membrane transporter protein n=1 Tax=Pandoraea nosoerga TaxID=2508296 RepID=A0A5E4WFU2_9BURK|nr:MULTISPECIES: sulfite exporter TauE/SafE family protein [Pandoraea]MBN4667801.1 sulfite exporter TauE/SafE family protein [Pandoraea nosoerga]MBN4675545.1 sulfite exporter TauE/SafE family protein [Pandoraea nosoerga]MBN4682638.1 sulfite exporter TauE/SafE family protein [Pandoraea nosoerga]MBN4746869.1 sulfite exporter TauE/SafE family protein [Pandoraea nosoerga]VVE23321.1 permease [Pandoraea nosoerga]